MIDLNGKKPLFRREHSRNNPVRALIMLTAVLAALFFLRGYGEGSVKPLFLATVTPTRTLDSYAQEGETHFAAGNLEKAIAAYQKATQANPTESKLWSELARIQVYSTRQLVSDEDRRKRLDEALQSATKATDLAPDDSMAHAIRAFALDWNADPVLAGAKSQDFLIEAELEANRAIQLDSSNGLALAYYGEILLDEQKLTQAEEYIAQAQQRTTNQMDILRINALLQENFGNYSEAIVQYQKALELTPNLTFLHIAIGVNYRQIKDYVRALDYFARAAQINAQLGINDPLPYIAIAKTYVQTGDGLTASLNIRKALDYNPYSADVYGQTGVIFFQARNYEGAIPALKCAIRGCTAQESCDVRQCDPATDPAITITGLPLNANTVAYYFTYGSVLAGMHQPGNNYCEEAMKVLAEVRKGYSNDPIVMNPVDVSSQICAGYNYKEPVIP
jgi:tetratricopeptide (TPR) repeat protein